MNNTKFNLLNVFKNFLEIIFYILFPLILISIYFLIVAYQNGWTEKHYESTYTLSDGKKIVVFQGMKHIGLNKFYQEVGNEITDYRNKNYKIINENFGHELIERLSNEHPEYFNKKNLYEYLKNIYIEKSNQYYNLKDMKYTKQNLVLLKYISYDDEVVDITKNELYEILFSNNSNYKNDKSPINNDLKNTYINNPPEHLDSLESLYKREKLMIFLYNTENSSLIKFLNKHLIPIMAKFDDELYLIHEITIKKRDSILSDFILKNDYDKFYINYGSAHFDGFFNNLKETNPEWKILNVSKKVVFDSTF